MKLIISPHYDDGILSLVEQTDSETILVTVFTKHNAEIYYKSDDTMKPYLNYPERKKENELVSTFLGIKIIDLNYEEACFRKNDNLIKQRLVTDILKLKLKLKVDTIYLPLGIGYHKDHILIFNLLKDIKINNKYFYFDYPYSSYELATKTRLSDFGIFENKLNFVDIIQFNNNLIYPSFVRKYHIIKNLGRYIGNVLYFNLFNRIFNYKIIKKETNISKKIKAISYYKSQINPIFGSKQLMENHLINYPDEHLMLLEENKNKDHKFYFILYLLPYISLLFLINSIYFCILFFCLLSVFYFDITNKKNINISKIKRNYLKFFFLIPFFNEQDNIKAFINCLPCKNNIKYVFINDCSEDDSRNILLDNLRGDFTVLERRTKANLVAEVLNVGLEYLKNINELDDNTFIGLLNCDCIFDSNTLLKAIKTVEENNIDMLNMRNKSIGNLNWISNIANEEKEFKFNLSKYGNVNLNNGYLIKSSLFDRYSYSWTEDLVLGNEIKGIKYQSDLIIYDTLPIRLQTLLKQKFRWIRGDIYYRISRLPKNIFDLIINIYYLLPMYFLLSIIFNLEWIKYNLLFLVLIESLLYFNFTGKISLLYSITQQVINLLFYIHLILFPFEW